MELAEAGLSDWPQLSSSLVPPTSSLLPRSPAPPADQHYDAEVRRRLKAEKRQRKEERAAKRASKQARKEEKERRKSVSEQSGEARLGRKAEGNGADVLIPASGQANRADDFTLSVSPTKEEPRVAPTSARSGLPTTSESRSHPIPAKPSHAEPTAPTKFRSRPVVELTPRSHVDSSDLDASPTKVSSSNRITKLKKRPRTSDTDDEDARATPSNHVRPSSKKASITKHIGTEKHPTTDEATRTSVEAKAKASTISEDDANAEAGPSTPITPTRRKSAGTPRKRSTSVTASGSSRAGGKKEDDDSLRARLANSYAMNEYLAAKFYPIAELNRLEQAGSESA